MGIGKGKGGSKVRTHVIICDCDECWLDLKYLCFQVSVFQLLVRLLKSITQVFSALCHWQLHFDREFCSFCCFIITVHTINVKVEC